MIRTRGCRLLVLVLLCSQLAGCIYTNVQRPLGTEYHQTELGTKVGQASSYSLLWLFAWGDAGTRAAAENGRLQVIRHADIRVFSLLFGLYSEVTTVVYGD